MNPKSIPMHVQFCLCSLMMFSILGVYHWCLYSTDFITTNAQSNHSSLLFFVAFSSVIFVIKACMEAIGRGIDKGKLGGSFYFLSGEMTPLLHYSVFYRSLFEHITQPWEVVILNVAHLVMGKFQIEYLFLFY